MPCENWVPKKETLEARSIFSDRLNWVLCHLAIVVNKSHCCKQITFKRERIQKATPISWENYSELSKNWSNKNCSKYFMTHHRTGIIKRSVTKIFHMIYETHHVWHVPYHQGSIIKCIKGKSTADFSPAFRHTRSTFLYTSWVWIPLGPLLLTWLNITPTLISNYTHYKLWDVIIYPFINFNGCTFEV